MASSADAPASLSLALDLSDLPATATQPQTILQPPGKNNAQGNDAEACAGLREMKEAARTAQLGVVVFDPPRVPSAQISPSEGVPLPLDSTLDMLPSMRKNEDDDDSSLYVQTLVDAPPPPPPLSRAEEERARVTANLTTTAAALATAIGMEVRVCGSATLRGRLARAFLSVPRLDRAWASGKLLTDHQALRLLWEGDGAAHASAVARACVVGADAGEPCPQDYGHCEYQLRRGLWLPMAELLSAPVCSGLIPINAAALPSEEALPSDAARSGLRTLPIGPDCAPSAAPVVPASSAAKIPSHKRKAPAAAPPAAKPALAAKPKAQRRAQTDSLDVELPTAPAERKARAPKPASAKPAMPASAKRAMAPEPTARRGAASMLDIDEPASVAERKTALRKPAAAKRALPRRNIAAAGMLGLEDEPERETTLDSPAARAKAPLFDLDDAPHEASAGKKKRKATPPAPPALSAAKEEKSAVAQCACSKYECLWACDRCGRSECGDCLGAYCQAKLKATVDTPRLSLPIPCPTSDCFGFVPEAVVRSALHRFALVSRPDSSQSVVIICCYI